MKEIVCKEVKKNANQLEMQKKIQNELGNKYHVDDCSYDVAAIWQKGMPYLFHERIAQIFIESKKIIVYDKRAYPDLKKFGKENKYIELMKCWEGAE